MKSYLLKSGLLVLSALVLPVSVAQADNTGDVMSSETVSRYWISPDVRPDFPQTAAKGAEGPIRDYDATTSSRDETDRNMNKVYRPDGPHEWMYGGS